MARLGKGRMGSIRLLVLSLTTLTTGAYLPVASAQESAPEHAADLGRRGETPGARIDPLAKLLDETERANPEIEAARRAAQAAAQEPSQASTLPDPEVMVQQLNVGSPRPFAGFSNSDFAYLGFGITQEIPYPGKLRLRGEIAGSGAAAASKQLEAVRRSVAAQLEANYFRLAAAQQTLAILERDGSLLDQIERTAEARYRVGQGNQQDVLKAQLERTKLLRDVALQRQEQQSLEAALKQTLNRPPDSPDITAESLTERPLPFTSDELLERVRAGSPEVSMEQESIRRQSLQVELARKDFYPDFSVQYVWQHTAEQFRDYHMITFGMRIPIYRSRRQRPELAEATEELDRSRRAYEARVQQGYLDVRDQFIAVETGARVLKIYREGLIPQAMATFRAGLSAYEANREDFETLLGSFLDVLKFDQEYWHALADHEVALARIEQLTGVTLPGRS